jgi:peroxiredoxin Q/BCP
MGGIIMVKTVSRVALWAGLGGLIAGCQQPLKVGSVAPDFTGMTDQGKTFRLSDLKGKSGVVLYFYPKDETPGCITEACAFRDRLAQLEAKGYTVVGVSLDSIDSHKKFKAKYSLPFTLIADDGTIARKYGVPLERKTIAGKPSELVYRETFLIDKNGLIKEQFTVRDPEAHVRQTLRALEVPY